jgi:acylphosphatase
MIKRVHVLISGDVIGVGFRAWTDRAAVGLGLTGWVKNAGYKTVEAVFEGPEEKLKEMVALCRKGPEVSWVEQVTEEWGEGTGEFLEFDIKY